MSDEEPLRMVDDSATSSELRALLQSTPEPPPFDAAAQARTLQAITAATGAGAALSAAPLSSSWWLKGTLVVLVGVVSVGVPWAIAKRAERERASAHTVSAPVSHSANHPVNPPVNPTVTVGAGAVGPAATAAPAPSVTVPREASSPSSAMVPSRESSRAVTRDADVHARDERDLLADAQRALERDADPARALSLLAEHRRRFARSPLDEERAYLAVRAHVRAGNAPEARRAASAFLSRYPRSLYAGAARRLVGSPP
jgi:hypothetical protein